MQDQERSGPDETRKLAEGLYELGQHVQAIRRRQERIAAEPWWREFRKPSGIMAVVAPLLAIAVTWGAIHERLSTLTKSDQKHDTRLDDIDRWRLSRDEALSNRFLHLEGKVRADLMDQISRTLEAQRSTDQKIDRLNERLDRIIDTNLTETRP